MTAYYDENLDKCVQSKGNGQLLKINHGMKCKSNYVGILPHYKSSKYYYVCKKNSVLMFKCSKKEYFNKISSMCEKRKKKVGNYIFSSSRLGCEFKKSIKQLIINSLPRTWSLLFVSDFVPIIRDNNYWDTFFKTYYRTDSTTSETTESIASTLPTEQTMIVIFLRLMIDVQYLNKLINLFQFL